ncbi:hypothetical protein EBT16_05185, partial [bacterium]|nr:hypothetical protein [bacterium]
MQIPITIKKQLFPIQKVEELFGEEVPFEIETYEADWENAKTGGFFDLSCWGVIEISGPDALDYLQRMSSANVKSLEVQSSTPGTFLTGKGTLVAMGTFWRPDSQRFLFTVSPNLIEKTLAHLEMFHFQEKLEIKNRTSDLAVIGLWKVPSSVLESSWHETRVPDLSYLVVNRIELEPKLLELSRKKLPFLGMHVFHYLRVRAGLPWMGWEVSEADLVLEAGLED